MLCVVHAAEDNQRENADGEETDSIERDGFGRVGPGWNCRVLVPQIDLL